MPEKMPLTQRYHDICTGKTKLPPKIVARYRLKLAEMGYEIPPLQNRRIARAVLNFAKAITQHGLHGFRKCTQEQIDARLAICQNCIEFYNSAKGICMHPRCGCNAVKKKKFLNKLAWADQTCPIGKWGEVIGQTQTESDADGGAEIHSAVQDGAG